MNDQLVPTKKTAASAQHLGDLFKEARAFGRIRLSTLRDGTYYAAIEFETLAGTELKAQSTFDEPTPEAAVKAAIAKAKIIAAQFK